MDKNLLTTGEIARQLGCTRDRVEYLLASRAIAPAARAGKNRVFDETVLTRLRNIIIDIERRNGDTL